MPLPPCMSRATRAMSSALPQLLRFCDRGFDLDDPDVAGAGQCDQVGAPAGRQGEFAQRRWQSFLGRIDLEGGAWPGIAG